MEISPTLLHPGAMTIISLPNTMHTASRTRACHSKTAWSRSIVELATSNRYACGRPVVWSPDRVGNVTSIAYAAIIANSHEATRMERLASIASIVLQRSASTRGYEQWNCRHHTCVADDNKEASHGHCRSQYSPMPRNNAIVW